MHQNGTYKMFAYIGHLNEVPSHHPLYSHIQKTEWIKDELNETKRNIATYLPDGGVYILRLRREFRVNQVSIQCSSISVNISLHIL